MAALGQFWTDANIIDSVPAQFRHFYIHKHRPSATLLNPASHNRQSAEPHLGWEQMAQSESQGAGAEI